MFKLLGRKPRVYKVSFHSSPYKDAIDSLKEIREKLYDYQGSIEWDFIRLHFGFMHVLKKHYEFFYDIHEYVRTLFRVYECKDLSIIADTFQLASFVCESNFTRAQRMTDLLLKGKVCSEIDGFNFVAKLMKMPYKNPKESYCSFYDVVQMHIVSCEKKMVKDLLEHGVMYIQLTDQKSTWTSVHKHLGPLLNWFIFGNPLLDLKAFQANLQKLSPERRQRMLAVIRGIDVLLRTKNSDYNYFKRDFALCFRMAYETIPEPFITSVEVADFLTFALTGPSAATHVDAIHRDYEKLFPESREPLAPRTLQHLSRCQLRETLRQKYTFPYGIKDLGLPASIEKYITSVENSYMLQQYEATVPSKYDSDDDSNHSDSDISYYSTDSFPEV